MSLFERKIGFSWTLFRVRLIRQFESIKQRFKNSKLYLATTTPHNFLTNAYFKLKTLILKYHTNKPLMGEVNRESSFNVFYLS